MRLATPAIVSGAGHCAAWHRNGFDHELVQTRTMFHKSPRSDLLSRDFGIFAPASAWNTIQELLGSDETRRVLMPVLHHHFGEKHAAENFSTCCWFPDLELEIFRPSRATGSPTIWWRSSGAASGVHRFWHPPSHRKMRATGVLFDELDFKSKTWR